MLGIKKLLPDKVSRAAAAATVGGREDGWMDGWMVLEGRKGGMIGVTSCDYQVLLLRRLLVLHECFLLADRERSIFIVAGKVVNL